jgi:hypothetical protein
MVWEKLADSGQKNPCATTQGFAAVGIVTISGKMEIFWALCRGGVEIGVRGGGKREERIGDCRVQIGRGVTAAVVRCAK